MDAYQVFLVIIVRVVGLTRCRIPAAFRAHHDTKYHHCIEPFSVLSAEHTVTCCLQENVIFPQFARELYRYFKDKA